MADEIIEKTKPKSEILKVDIHCVNPPDKMQQAGIIDFIREKYDAHDIVVEIINDPAVIDGFNLFVGDDNYDWSTLGRIRQLRRSIQALPKTEGYENIISLLKEDISEFFSGQ